MRAFFRVIAIILSISLLTSLRVSARGEGIGEISARSACLIEAESGRVLYSKGADRRMPMASTTKIMTAIVALESGASLDRIVKIPKCATGIEGSSIYLREGEEITLENLIYALLLSSANDAAVAISIAISGSVEDFVSLMNEKAGALGLSNTHFTNPHGLNDDEHYTTAKDLAALMAYCVKNSIFVNISGTSKRVVGSADSELTRVMINHNRLLTSYKGVIAGKTGYTKSSGRCLVTCAERNGLRLIAVTLNAPNDWQDHSRLYDFGFENYENVNFDAFSLKIPLISGKISEISVKSDAFSLILPKNRENISIKINAPRFLFAQIKKGDAVGEVKYICNGKIIARSPLIAEENGEKINYKFNIFTWLADLIKEIFN